MNRSVVAGLCTILLHSPNEKDRAFLWGFFLAMLPHRLHTFDAPPEWDIGTPAVKNCSLVSLTDDHRINILKMFQTFTLSFPDEKVFSGALYLALPVLVPLLSKNDREICALFDFASTLPVQDCIAQLALEMIGSRPIRATQALEKALAYIQAHFYPQTFPVVLPFLISIILSDLVNNFLFQRTSELIKVILDVDDLGPAFVIALQHLVALAWNRHAAHCPLAKRVFLLQLSDFCAAPSSFDGWPAFVESVLTPFRNRERFSREFTFSEETMSPDLVRLITDPTEIAGFITEHFSVRRKSGNAAGQMPGPRVRHRKRKSAPMKKKCNVA
jgi:hypothetical protein